MAIVSRQLKRNRMAHWITFSFQGRTIWEHGGNNLRDAKALEAKRKDEVAAGTYFPTSKPSPATTVGKFAEDWIAGRTNRNAKSERSMFTRHVMTFSTFMAKPIGDVRKSDVNALVDLLKKKALAPRTIANLYGLLRTMFVEAETVDLVAVNPCVVARNKIDRARRRIPQPYTAEEVFALIYGGTNTAEKRVFAALAFYTGAREGEICGLRWGDWDRLAKPLGSLTIERQYGGGPTKTSTTRRVPVHPALAEILDAWWAGGFELMNCRPPSPTEHIVPMRKHGRMRHPLKPHHTKSSAYKMWVATCKGADVENRTLHSTRHTMISFARRGGASKEHLALVTHNAKGDVVDQYTNIDWRPLCEAVACISYFERPQDPRPLRETAGNATENACSVDRPITTESHKMLPPVSGSIPGASTHKVLANKVAAKAESKTPQNDSAELGDQSGVELVVLHGLATALSASWEAWERELYDETALAEEEAAAEQAVALSRFRAASHATLGARS